MLTLCSSPARWAAGAGQQAKKCDVNRPSHERSLYSQSDATCPTALTAGPCAAGHSHHLAFLFAYPPNGHAPEETIEGAGRGSRLCVFPILVIVFRSHLDCTPAAPGCDGGAESPSASDLGVYGLRLTKFRNDSARHVLHTECAPGASHCPYCSSAVSDIGSYRCRHLIRGHHRSRWSAPAIPDRGSLY